MQQDVEAFGKYLFEVLLTENVSPGASEYIRDGATNSCEQVLYELRRLVGHFCRRFQVAPNEEVQRLTSEIEGRLLLAQTMGIIEEAHMLHAVDMLHMLVSRHRP